MSKYLHAAKTFQSILEGEKPHSSITDWVDILTSDRYEEDSMDGILELVESIRIQGADGVAEASRALRKKLKYGNVHRQIRAMSILRALTENGGKTFQHHFMNPQLMQRLRDMATDSLTDPKVKRKMISVFHAWSLAFADDPKMSQVAALYAQYSGKKIVRKPTAPTNTTATAATTTTPSRKSSTFEDLEHSWAPKGYTAGSSDKTYADLAAAKEEAETRKREREARAALEAREAEIERRERALKNKETDRARAEEARRKATEAEALRKKEAELARREKALKAKQPKRPPFDFAKEKPQILVAIANASQAANNLVNACRHVNREKENITENVKVLEYLEKAKAARRPIIRYIQVVVDEEFVGTLLEANEKIVEAIQLFDKLSKPAVLDSDSEHEEAAPKDPTSERDIENMRLRLEAQKLEAQRTGELDKLQQKQKLASQRAKERRTAASGGAAPSAGGGSQSQPGLPPPMTPDETPASETWELGSLSDFSDYDSSDEEYRASHSRRASFVQPVQQPLYRSLEDDEGDAPSAKAGLLDPNDPFADPDDFLGSIGSSNKPKERMEWTAI